MNFNPRTPYGVRPAKATDRQHTAQHFNPRTPYGVRPQGGAGERPAPHFNPRTPCGVRPWLRAPWGHGRRFQSTHPLRGATRFPRARCGSSQFQSTHPLRGATSIAKAGEHSKKAFQSTHPLRGATDRVCKRGACGSISIHAPLAGCDANRQTALCSFAQNFNPRTPCGVRRERRPDVYTDTAISIHAPLAGCDCREKWSLKPRTSISIHAPLAGCDIKFTINRSDMFISIHAPLAGCDRSLSFLSMSNVYFNPRTPCGVRHALTDYAPNRRLISIHAPLAGCDHPINLLRVDNIIFQSTHPLRGATPINAISNIKN